jgi:chromosome segregation ATPase
MIGSLNSLKQLESLVKQVTEALHKASSENRELREKLRRAENEAKRLRDELKEASLTLARHERLRARLSRLSEKLERIS